MDSETFYLTRFEHRGLNNLSNLTYYCIQTSGFIKVGFDSQSIKQSNCFCIAQSQQQSPHRASSTWFAQKDEKWKAKIHTLLSTKLIDSSNLSTCVSVSKFAFANSAVRQLRRGAEVKTVLWLGPLGADSGPTVADLTREHCVWALAPFQPLPPLCPSRSTVWPTNRRSVHRATRHCSLKLIWGNIYFDKTYFHTTV